MNQAVKAAKKPVAKKAAAPMLVKFKTGYGADKIEAVEVLRETSACVFLPLNRGTGERREAKVSEYAQYHDTWAEAHAYLMLKAQNQVIDARLRLKRAEGHLGNVKGLKPPKDSA